MVFTTGLEEGAAVGDQALPSTSTASRENRPLSMFTHRGESGARDMRSHDL